MSLRHPVDTHTHAHTQCDAECAEGDATERCSLRVVVCCALKQTATATHLKTLQLDHTATGAWKEMRPRGGWRAHIPCDA